jgi:poly(A) polymerase
MERALKLSAEWVNAAASQRLLHLLEDAGHQALFVGGCVRNGLIGFPVTDIDVATDALPARVTSLAEQAMLRVVPTGVEHGTVTVIVDDTPHEITTFRKDVATDGRRATVEFSQDVGDDARRRDFTMNALYARSDGTVVDPLGGFEDLEARRVRFIEDAETRIKEDYLRILRFFRFYAWFGDSEQGLDQEGLAACASLADGVELLSKERVGTEMLKLLAAPNPAPAIAAMRHAGILNRVLPGADDVFLAPLIHLEEGAQPSSLSRLAVLGGENVSEMLRLSKTQSRTLALLSTESAGVVPPHEIGYRFGAEIGRSILLLRAAYSSAAVSKENLSDLEIGENAVFPISAQDLMPSIEGAELGRKLKQLEQIWIDSRFMLTRSDLLS